MLGSFGQALPSDAVKIVLVLFLSFLVGLEREEHKTAGAKYAFGGVRTFPLIGLVGYATAYLSGGQVVPILIGLVVVAGFLWISYWHKLQTITTAGVTSEISALATYLAGALVARDAFWVATALSVSGATLVASGVMYVRLAVLVGLFNRQLLAILGVPFLILAAAGLVPLAWIWGM